MQDYNFGEVAPFAPLANSTLLKQTEEIERPAQGDGKLHRDNARIEFLGADSFVVADMDAYVEAIPAIDGSSDEGGEGGQESGGTESGSTEPVEEVSTSYEIVSDEESWNSSFANGVLKAYYEKYPSEDLWNNAENRAANFNDRHYEGTIDGVAVEADVTWASADAQKLTVGGDVYYAAIFYDFELRDLELFNDVALTESAGKTFVMTAGYYANCEHSYQGWIANGAQAPWICPNFLNDDPAAKIIFRYEGLDDVTPWGDALFGNGEGHKAWGTASAVAELGVNDFDESKFQMVLLKNA
jgi:hypothetical protein